MVFFWLCSVWFLDARNPRSARVGSLRSLLGRHVDNPFRRLINPQKYKKNTVCSALLAGMRSLCSFEKMGKVLSCKIQLTQVVLLVLPCHQ